MARPASRNAVLAVVLASDLMIVLDISIVVTALPKIQAGLGFSVTGLSWVVNLPIGLLLMAAARRVIAETPKRTGWLDAAGAVLSTLGMVALVYGLVHVASEGWRHWGSLGPLMAGLVLLALFLLNEARTPQPILPLRLFASRPRAAAFAARMLFLGGMIGFWFYTTQYLRGIAAALTASSVLLVLAFAVVLVFILRSKSHGASGSTR